MRRVRYKMGDLVKVTYEGKEVFGYICNTLRERNSKNEIYKIYVKGKDKEHSYFIEIEDESLIITRCKNVFS